MRNSRGGCPDCGTVVEPMPYKVQGRRVYRCVNPGCGLKFYKLNSKIIYHRYQPWGYNADTITIDEAKAIPEAGWKKIAEVLEEKKNG